MHSRETVDRALRLCAAGRTTRDVARATGLAERTVAHWRSGDRRRNPVADRTSCARCRGEPVGTEAYAYLLGRYLGDGHITTGRRTKCLWVYCGDDWPGIRDEVKVAMRAVLPTSAVSSVRRTGCVALKSYSVHWLCYLPQHGAGPKHLRRIVLEPWQQEAVERHIGAFLRGLFHSDGCRLTNWATRRVGGTTKRYEYPRYFFTNKSTDILDLCADALTRLGVAHTRPDADTISVPAAPRWPRWTCTSDPSTDPAAGSCTRRMTRGPATRKSGHRIPSDLPLVREERSHRDRGIR